MAIEFGRHCELVEPQLGAEAPTQCAGERPWLQLERLIIRPHHRDDRRDVELTHGGAP